MGAIHDYQWYGCEWGAAKEEGILWSRLQKLKTEPDRYDVKRSLKDIKTVAKSVMFPSQY